MTKLKSALILVLVMITGAIFGQTYEDVVAKFNTGADHINKGEFTIAITHLQEVLAMAETIGSEADDLAGKSKTQIPLLNYQAAIGFMRQKDYENAIPYLENTIDLANAYGNNAEYKDKAMKYLPQLLTGVGNQRINSDCEGAVELFESAVKYSPTYAKAHLGLGLCHKSNYNEEEMIESLTKAIELASAKNDAKTVVMAQEGLSSYFVEMGKMELEDMDPAAEDFDYAVEAFERALEFHPENSDANYQLSIINNRLAEYDLALKYGLKALESETVEVKIAAINYEIGNAYYNNAELDLACEAFKKALVDVIEDIARAKMERIPGCE
ncbi:MAG: tetratricopeptide repeat protein [Bacteroidales bacterium]|nr:tetratricopeptide repeat protein [Bacteroidales bacterium]